MNEMSCRLLVLGAGPGGYVCAIRAGQLGVDTVIVDAGKLGGTCLNVGCIPSKALIHVAEEYEKCVLASRGQLRFGLSVAAPRLDMSQAIGWKDEIVGRLNTGVAGLLKKARAKVVQGVARFVDGRTVAVETETGRQVIRAERIVIATGSQAAQLADIPFGGDVMSSTEALALTSVPKRLVVIGGGYIGLELGTAFRKLGSEVTVVEAQARILAQYDEDLVEPIEKRLAELNVKVMTGAAARGLGPSGHTLRVGSVQADEHLEFDKLLVTVGRVPATSKLGLDELVVDMDGRFIRVNDRCETSLRGIYAIGDVTGEPMLAHRAMAQGEMVAEIVAGHARAWDKRCIPAICFTDPEIVSVGLSPDEAASASEGEVKTAQFPFAANGRAMTLNASRGFVRIVARADNGLILGIQAVGNGIAEMSAMFAHSIEMGARVQDVAATIHAHPTLGEAIQESALKAMGHAIHM